MKPTAVTIDTQIQARLAETFAHIVPIDLPSIFTGYGPLPAVARTLDQTGPWDAVGRSRTVVFSDGSSATESLTGYDYPNGFTYRITGFTGVLRYLATEARGQWWFESLPGKEATFVRWRYEFVSRSRWLRPIVALFTQQLWGGYMRRALHLSKAQVELLAIATFAQLPPGGTMAFSEDSR